MDVILALIQAFAALEPTVAAAIPTVETLIAGNKVTSAQMVTLWQAVAALERLAASKAAGIEAPAEGRGG